MNTEAMLTTEDNPYNPFTQFNEWFEFDESHGYHTCAYLDRITNTSSELSDADNEKLIELALQEALRLNITGNYKIIKNI